MQSLVHDLHFEMKPGKVLGLVGESGSGKTITCMSVLQLLDRKTTSVEGSIRLQGRELNGLREEEMRNIRGKEIGFIMQNPMNAFSPVYTIGNQFIETIRTHSDLSKKQAKELAVDSMEAVNLPDPSRLMRKYPFQLSGGMLQRVMIAISMCLRPSLVIADEPTTALDVTNQLQVLRQLDRLRSECGTSILLISHDLGVISELADEVAVMHKGRIVERADVFQLFDHPRHEYTKKLLHSRPVLPIKEQTKELVL
ncbi:nickel import ATP-binding protein NikD [Mesobacillus foraminis]|uniref:nickel import ATP-binding protein NikD n=1 Tax=Mesobacillus foraminis TaxID=279826 RepID=UPI001BECA20C|nr:nickel import ATP-binding protein NikD [Mesobacillus foraminis]MBT2757567.1 nickel import ATP-binding protein NikD [Mesobacillus foraminis]